MAQIVTVTNQKGGVGKSTIAVNIAMALKELGKKVLLIDVDGQGNSSATVSRDARINNRPGGSECVFYADKPIEPISTPLGIDLLHGHTGLENVDREVKAEEAAKLKHRLAALDYDFIIIDTPPSLGVRQLSALMWADNAVIPTKASSLDVQGTASTIRVIRSLESKMGLQTKWKIIVNMFVNTSKQQTTMFDSLRQNFPNNFVPIPLGQRVGVSDSLAIGKPVWEYSNIPREVADSWRSLPNTLGLI